ncbi:MAG: copper ion binding protein [Tissierellaceae bacterium]|jgi:copper chaperone|nr:heavy-metal-associated domain-containing protein [Tissierellia bacterium]
MTKTILVEGMSCQHCVKAVESALKELTEVNKVEVDLSLNKVVVEGEDLVEEKLIEAIEEAGYEVKNII